MNNKIILVVIAVIIIAGGAWLIFGKNDNSTNNGYSSGTSSSNSSQSNANSQSSSTSSVSITNFSFSPASITVKKGTMVTWTNNDNVTHTVTKDNADTGPDSSDLTPGSVYRFTYNQVGTFAYHCKFHSDMHGTVTVTE